MPAFESYEPLPKQREFHEAKEPFKCFMGGFGAGKSLTLAWEVIDQCMSYPKNRWVIMRDVMPDLRDSTQASFFESCPPEFIARYNRRDEKVVLVNGSEILFRSFRQYRSSPRNQNETKIKSLNLGGFAIDEANEITKNEFLLLQGRLRLDTVPRHGGILATNPPNTDHWIFELFAGDKADKSRYRLVQASSRANTYLPPDFVPNLEKEYPPAWVKKFIDGEFGFLTVGDPVYTGFSEGWHTRSLNTLPALPIHRYWDFGFHRPAVVWAQVTSEGKWLILSEHMGKNVYLEPFAENVIRLSNENFPGMEFLDFGDPAGKMKNDKSALSSIDILKERFNIAVRCRYSTVQEGVDIVQRKLTSVLEGEAAILIDKDKCPILCQGLAGAYTRERALDGRGMAKSDPIKDGYFEHLQDALRYGAVNVFGSGGSISPSRSGDFQVNNPTWNRPSAGVASAQTPGQYVSFGKSPSWRIG